MTEIDENPDYMSTLPTELLINISIYLPAKSLMRCRQVCCRWKSLVDTLACNDDLWKRYCKSDFPNHHREARGKAQQRLLWSELYKSMSIWGRLAEATEEIDEFASASGIMEEIRMFQINSVGDVAVLNKNSLKYYDLSTLELCNRSPFYGGFSRFIETDNVIAILDNVLQLHIIRLRDYGGQTDVTFQDVKLFTTSDRAVYFVTLNDDIFMCDLVKDDQTLSGELIKHSEDGVMVLGCVNEQLNVLTFKKNIYYVVKNKMIYQTTLGPDCNLFNQLQKYNLLDQMDWRIYVQWMYMFQRKIPDGPFTQLIIVHRYCNVFIVGSNWGVLQIYYAPSLDGKDLFELEPIKQYNFMERPILEPCPIIGVDVSEIENGHKVLVAMPKKIVVLIFKHDFMRTESWTKEMEADEWCLKCPEPLI